ncbi:Lrp/AsnC family transcriptional regulator [Microbacterium sp. No. 7]|uniref:Lrp/AsnC family transcriptional regulator n=1 Tax=Microbacterium sp. No. 7 TaxID=1714373 RepID=UPI0006D18FB7|nr:Lrp/AsnC family transcriptional regulator [Microbacterium sp. No. 7]ALJ19313.1 hypothetical protein AOA12_05090 [Microbacterium sp. No. 7]
MGRRSGEEVDLQIAHALQIAPRASWSDLGDALGLSESTVARRWAHMTERGDAWLGAYVAAPHTRMAMVMLSLLPARFDDVVGELSRVGAVGTIEEVSGRWDLLVSVTATSVSRLARTVRVVRGLDGVTDSNVVVFSGLTHHAVRWRLDALSPAQAARVAELAPQPSYAPLSRIDAFDGELAHLLSLDARTPAATLARELSVSINKVRRRLARLMDSGWLSMRCDVSMGLSGHEFVVYLYFRVPPAQLPACATALGTLPEVRLVGQLAGPHNLMCTVLLRKPQDLQPFELRLAEICPEAQIFDRTVVMRAVKRIGRVLDDAGRVQQVVALDYLRGLVPGEV